MSRKNNEIFKNAAEDKNHYRVYRFLDKDNHILYIGKSKRFKSRMLDHLRGNSNVGKECISKIKRIEFLDFSNECDMDIFEIYAINYFQPLYNKSNKSRVGIGDIKIYMPQKWNELNLDTFKDTMYQEEIIPKEFMNFNKEIFLNQELSDFLEIHFNKKLTKQDKNDLLNLCNKNEFSIDDLNNYIVYNNPQAVLKT